MIFMFSITFKVKSKLFSNDIVYTFPSLGKVHFFLPLLAKSCGSLNTLFLFLLDLHRWAFLFP